MKPAPVVVASTYDAARTWLLKHRDTLGIPADARLVSTSVGPERFLGMRIGRIYTAPCAPTGKHYPAVIAVLERASAGNARPLI